MIEIKIFANDDDKGDIELSTRIVGAITHMLADIHNCENRFSSNTKFPATGAVDHTIRLKSPGTITIFDGNAALKCAINDIPLEEAL